MSKELKVMEPKQYDDEIDLYELIEILVRHKWSIVITIVLCTILSLGAALYVRSKAPNYLIKSILIQQDTYGLKEVNRINVDTILLQDKNVEKILEIEPIKAKYLGKMPKEMQNMASERKFLQDIITVSKNEKNPEEISIKTEIIVDENSSRDVINRYIDILREQDNLSDVIEKEKKLKSDSLEKTKVEIENIQNEILEIFKKDSDLRALKPEEKMNYIASKYPELNLRKNEQEKYYNTYVNELVRLDSLNDKMDIIKETTDIYFLKGQSKAKLILAVGIVMGVFLGVMVAFLKEFIDGYKKRYKK
ncbi:Wzz/FepE/Etk N-terminal domain-containing protein [Cetobacterium somerae]|uniref:Wzz/FepE/Etk N-terminal domain-containing protein n=1 Tax=Cetobacterium somerae TaxID=188913 RepID=UPI002253AA0A|nr:Wzz/FepE/Etk N-terminal domain-containing protein [Cetobacterium somerae]MCX3068159.1 Wzz/FepE/Etk N-terminal domain-containing protein [Cetobacterium somerae]